MEDNEFNIAHIEYNSRIYGPGQRTVIWFQGCSLHCKGCWNVEYQSFESKIIVERNDLLKAILSHRCPVTFLGGEPLQQSDNLMWLICELKLHNVHIMLYTGYELSEIRANDNYLKICNNVDILITGRYVESLRDTNLIWRGSSNQLVIVNDGTVIPENKNEVEITIDKYGAITCLGYPDLEFIDFIRKIDFTE